MDNHNLTELQQAERTARYILKTAGAWSEDYVVFANVFLAQQARLAEVERERDAATESRRKYIDRLNETMRERESLIGRLAAAERKATEAAREALTRLSDEARLALLANIAQYIREFRDREYPAPTERKQYTEGIVLKPTPQQAAPEPPSFSHGISQKNETSQGCEPELFFQTQNGVLFLKASDCRRIVETGRASGRGE